MTNYFSLLRLIHYSVDALMHRADGWLARQNVDLVRSNGNYIIASFTGQLLFKTGNGTMYFQVTVSVRLVFLKVGEIDTVKETFTADVYIQARWREPKFDHQTELVRDCISISYLNVSRLIVHSLLGPTEALHNSLKSRPKCYTINCGIRQLCSIHLFPQSFIN